MDTIKKLLEIYKVLKEKDVLSLHRDRQIWFPYMLLHTLKYQLLNKKNIYIGSKSIINNTQNIELINDGRLEVAIGDFGIKSKMDSTFINIRNDSKMIIDGIVSIGRGSNIGLAPKSTLKIGKNTFITGNSRIICTKNIVIGSDCAISWNVQLLDNDFHTILENGEVINQPSEIIIGNHVWIGSNVTILKGVTIGDNCIIGANSLVTKSIPNDCLVVGNPAKIKKKNIKWEK